MNAVRKKHDEYYHNSGEYVIRHNIEMPDGLRNELVRQGNWLMGLYNGELIPFREKQIQFVETAQIIKENLKSDNWKLLFETYHQVDDFELSEVCKKFLKLQVVDKIISMTKEGKASQKFHEELRNKIFLKEGLEKKILPKKEKSYTPKDNFNPFIHKRTKEPLIKKHLFTLTHDLEYYLNEISGLNNDEKELIRKKEFVWTDIFQRDFKELNHREKQLLRSLAEEYGNGSDRELSLFQYFFKGVENINSKGRRTFTIKDNPFFTRDDAKKMRKMMFSEMKKNHRQ